MNIQSISGLNCAEAANLCEKTEYNEASAKEKLTLKLHLFFCKTCQNYYNGNKRLTDLLRKSKLQTYSPLEKEALKHKLQEKSEAFKSHQN